ncbi:hypothetical protein Tco_0638747, partial [Tanacetum coccineum]
MHQFKQGLSGVTIVKEKGMCQGNSISQRGLGTQHGSRKKILLVQAHESGQELDEEQLAFLADLRVEKSQDT